MLILLTGASGVGKKHLAKFITNSLNNFSVNGIAINYKFNSEGNIKTTFDNIPADDHPDDYKSHMIQYADNLYNTILEYDSNCNMHDKYMNIMHDLGIYDEINGTEEILSTDSILSLYNSKPVEMEHTVIYGIFSSYFIDALKNELQDELQVFNIIRNPSVAYLMVNPDDSAENFCTSIMLSGLLINNPNVTTVKFEDIIKNSLVINDITIELGSGYSPYNNYITMLDQYSHITQDLTEANNALTIFNPEYFFDDDGLNDDVVTDANDVLRTTSIVHNIFDLYPDYAALTYEEITSS